MRTAIVAVLMLFACIVVAQAKCAKGKRLIDGITKAECGKLDGKWIDARDWQRTRNKRVIRPKES